MELACIEGEVEVHALETLASFLRGMQSLEKLDLVQNTFTSPSFPLLVHFSDSSNVAIDMILTSPGSEHHPWI